MRLVLEHFATSTNGFRSVSVEGFPGQLAILVNRPPLPPSQHHFYCDIIVVRHSNCDLFEAIDNKGLYFFFNTTCFAVSRIVLPRELLIFMISLIFALITSPLLSPLCAITTTFVTGFVPRFLTPTILAFVDFVGFVGFKGFTRFVAF
jgi:hypothetical protein